MLESSLLVISRAFSKSLLMSTGWTLLHTLRFLVVTLVSVMYRSTAIAAPTANTRRIGYMNGPPVTKNPTTE
jgi:hypothetical protein